nr:nucleoside deaminase [Corynebacterium sp. 13CS0277]
MGGGLPPAAWEQQAAAWMRQAIAVADTTPTGDVPVGAIVVDSAGRIIARGTNRREADQDPTAHAEVLALRAAARHLGRWRLDDCTLVVTLEPCAMCAGAVVGARLGRLYFGAYEPKTGHVGSVHDTLRDSRALHPVAARGGILRAACEEQLGRFFQQLRAPLH